MDGNHSDHLCDKNKRSAEKGSGASQDAPAKEEDGKGAKALPMTGTGQDSTTL